VPSPRATIRARRGYDAQQIAILLGGNSRDCLRVFGDDRRRAVSARVREGECDAPHLVARRREAWECLRDELLPDWIVEYPGSRPAAWWEFDSPGRRERIDGEPCPGDVAEYPKYPQGYELGVPLQSVFTWPVEREAGYESQRDFLTRHNLLTESEVASA